MDTICALSTPWGRSALALIRVSGPSSIKLLISLSGKDIPTRAPTLLILKDRNGRQIDEALVTVFKGPNSFTGEDLLEICCHGNPLIVRALLDEIVSRETIRTAEPGEFTARAIANEKLSLDQVESLDWILNASSMDGVRRGLQAKISGISKATSEVYGQVLDLVSSLQAQLDFSDDEVGSTDRKEIMTKIDRLVANLKIWSAAFETSKHLFESWVVVLVGPPNSGKSSLFNALIGQNKSIVFDQPGTTRDYLEHLVEIDGVSVLLVDTAGVRASSDPVEKIGIEKTFEAMKRADLICWVDELGKDPESTHRERFQDKTWLYLRSKADLHPESKITEDVGSRFLDVSVLSGVGISELKRRILPKKSELGSGSDSWAPLTSLRQRSLVDKAVNHLQTARGAVADGQYLDMVTEELLQASKAIAGIIDPPDTSDVLKQIFSRFCIGK